LAPVLTLAFARRHNRSTVTRGTLAAELKCLVDPACPHGMIR